MNIFVLIVVLVLQVPGHQEAHVLSNGYASQEECEAARAQVIAAADKDGSVTGYSASPCLSIPVPSKA